MNFISWATKPTIINENTQNYISDVRLDEATEIGKLVAPMANKMKNIKVNGQKVKVGTPYRDTRLFFLNYLKDEYPELVPDGFKAYSAAHVHKLIGEIAMNSPEKLKDIFDNFKDWSETKVPAGDGKEVDRMTQYINTKATLRQGKGVRQSRDAEAATGGIKRDFTTLKVDDISDASAEKEKKEIINTYKEKIDNVEGMMSNDADGEAITIIPAIMKVLGDFHEEIEEMNLDSDGFKSQLQILDNVIGVVPSIRTLSKYKEFVNYLDALDEYGEIRQYFADQIPHLEAGIARFAETEDNEHEDLPKPDFLDVNNNGNKTESMKKALEDVVTQKALRSAIKKEEEEVEGYTVTTERGDRSFPKNREGLTAAYEFIQGKNNWIIKYGDEVVDQSEDVEEVSLEDATTLSHEEYEAVQNFQSFDPSEWQEKADRSGWERKHQAEEAEEHSTSQYMSKAPVEAREEAEEVKMSQLEINQHLAVQERQRVQNLYAQQRRHTHGY